MRRKQRAAVLRVEELKTNTFRAVSCHARTCVTQALCERIAHASSARLAVVPFFFDALFDAEFQQGIFFYVLSEKASARLGNDFRGMSFGGPSPTEKVIWTRKRRLTEHLFQRGVLFVAVGVIGPL